MPQRKQRPAGRCRLAIAMLITTGVLSNACSSPGMRTGQAVPPTPTAAVSSPSFSASATPSPTDTRRHRAAATPSPAHTGRRAVATPSPTHARRPVRRHTSPPKAAPAPRPACHPLTNSGNCYEPGEFCRKSDHGASGVAGNGERIRCENNNGWRWEPV